MTVRRARRSSPDMSRLGVGAESRPLGEHAPVRLSDLVRHPGEHVDRLERLVAELPLARDGIRAVVRDEEVALDQRAQRGIVALVCGAAEISTTPAGADPMRLRTAGVSPAVAPRVTRP